MPFVKGAQGVHIRGDAFPPLIHTSSNGSSAPTHNVASHYPSDPYYSASTGDIHFSRAHSAPSLVGSGDERYDHMLEQMIRKRTMAVLRSIEDGTIRNPYRRRTLSLEAQSVDNSRTVGEDPEENSDRWQTEIPIARSNQPKPKYRNPLLKTLDRQEAPPVSSEQSVPEAVSPDEATEQAEEAG